jgi:hypothetical protein
MEQETVFCGVGIGVYGIEAAGIERAGAADQAMHLITAGQQQFGQIRPVLARNACNQRFFGHKWSESFSNRRTIGKQEVVKFKGVVEIAGRSDFCICSRARANVAFGVNQKKTASSWIMSFFGIFMVIAVSRGTAVAAPRERLAGHVPDVVAGLQSSGRLPGGTQLKLAIGLPLRNQQALNNLIHALYDPVSPQYRHYLTPEQFTENFGPTIEDYQAVVNFAKASGFTVTATHSDRMLLEVTAEAADVERAFQVSMGLYPHPTEARSFYAPDVEPSVPSDLRIADISGLNNYSYPHPKNLKRKLRGPVANDTSMDGSGPNGSLIGSDFRAAYAPGVTNTGTGQMVGLFEFDGYYPNDIASYATQAKLTNPPPVKAVLLDGFNGVPGIFNSEVALDIELNMAMAPGLSEILVYEASTNEPANVILSAMTTNTAVKQFTCSWDWAASTSNPRTTMDGYFQKFVADGQSFFDASGDGGAYTGAIPEPDDDTNITIVGGTTLLTSSPGGSWLGETTWNAPDDTNSSGGGITTTYVLPGWQSGVKTNGNGASTSHRNLPDVAMVADNIFVVADDGQAESQGGTSCSAQLWGAFIALVNQQSVADGHSTVGFINSNIYALYKTTAYAADFDDITFGNNTNGDTGFYATPGYDLCTGLGSPSGGSLIIALASPDGFVITPGRGFTANGPSGGPFNVSAQTVSVANLGASSLNWSVGGAPAWLNVSSQGGTISHGGAPASVTIKLNTKANTMAPGVYTANLWFTNLTSGQAQLRQFTLQVGQNLVHDGSFESADFAYWTMTGLDAWYYSFVSETGTYPYYSPPAGFGDLDCAVLGESNGLAYISQPLPTLPGQLYLISLWLENPTNASGNIDQFIVEWDTATSTNMLYNQSNLGVFGWENLQFFAFAPTNTTLLQFGSRNDQDYFALDDISVVPVPLPTVQSIKRAGQTVDMSWNSLLGLAYQVQSTTNLLHAQWVDLGSPITADGSTVTTSETIAAGIEQFYRVVLLVQL